MTARSELIARLRLPCYERGLDEGWIDSERKEAATAIEALADENWRLRSALAEIANGLTNQFSRLEDVELAIRKEIKGIARNALTPPETTT